MKTIPLSKGREAIVDDEDFDFLMQWKWHAYSSYKVWYARRFTLKSDSADGKQHPILMHRVVNKTPVGVKTDHKNGNGLDNRKTNLRNATHFENMRNRGTNRGATSDHKGVDWDSRQRKWRAQICVNNQKIFLGRFSDEADAASAYLAASAKHFGEFHHIPTGSRP